MSSQPRNHRPWCRGSLDGSLSLENKMVLERFKELPVQFCAADGCTSPNNLKYCKKCKLIKYCSRTCQVAHWPQHKSSCDTRQLMTELGQYPPNIENPLQRHRRLFCARFGISITEACVSALELWRDRENISRFACIIHLRPRPHREAGARFTLHDFQVVPRELWVEGMMRGGSERAHALLDQHEIERKRLHEITNGGADYLTIAIWAKNEGPHKLEGEFLDEVGFSPQLVPWKLVEMPHLRGPRLDWFFCLRAQIENDEPSRPLARIIP